MQIRTSMLDSLKKKGYCKVPGVLDTVKLKSLREKFLKAEEETDRRGIAKHIPGLDPNEQNVRIFNLLDLDTIFIELISHPTALQLVRYLLTDDFIISNFTANTARPGSRSMEIHSDTSLIHPPPWTEPWSINIIWFLDDAREENGATRYLPGSHYFQQPEELTSDALKKMRPLEANAGSIIAMDGRLWHTSGENRTSSQERTLLFGYYSRSFLRPQWNFNVGLSDHTKSLLGSDLKKRLGLELAANIALDPNKITTE